MAPKSQLDDAIKIRDAVLVLMEDHMANTLKHVFPLRKNVNVMLELPRDLTAAEVKRIVAFIETLVLPLPEGDYMGKSE